jgi:hypothetical protein
MNRKIIRPQGRRSIKDFHMPFGVHLVYSEGTKTEPYYVENFKKLISNKYKCHPNDIEIINANGKQSYNTKFLVDFAIEDVIQRLNRGERINHVWIFFDKDSFPSVNFNSANKQIEELNNSEIVNDDGFCFSKETGISWHSCWTNEAFELWLCLYFNRITSSLDRKQYITHLENIPSLKAKGFKYEKNLTDIHDILSKNGGRIDLAIRFAKDINKTNGTKNPSTGVYLFAEYFLPYMG